MKKLYFLVALVATSLASFSQGRSVDLEVSEIISPKSIHSGVTIVVKAVLKNNGPDDLTMSDTLLYRGVVITTPTQFLALRPGRVLKMNDTMHINMQITNFTFQGTANQNFCIQAAVTNRSMDSVKIETTTGANNTRCEVIWYSDGTSGIFTLGSKLDGAKMFPNPVVDNAIVRFNNPEAGEVTLNIMDLSGRVISTQTENKNSGTEEFEVNVAELSAGIYLYKVTSGQHTVTKKFTVQ
jgi:hypothetical protein